MRERSSVGRVCALLVVVAALLTGCQTLSSSGAGRAGHPTGSGTASATRSPGYGAVFLAVDECSSFGTTSFTEVPCTSERAAARVVARFDGTEADGPRCPATTDFVLRISAQNPSSGENGDAPVPQGYACMRNLEPPHPGDPGGGGGPRTIVGDCVYGSGSGQVRETACDGSGTRKPQYQVVSAVARRTLCPAGTALYVRLDGDRPVGCARRM
ncbi:LppU/SCO3897 family protein [Streptomyces sediminimaris]|uniref:LppU/SCO3897 family protein n=1 Tax=Streptomyces sediminimaris TaxID=3383721 RepID=UPI003999FEE4